MWTGPQRKWSRNSVRCARSSAIIRSSERRRARRYTTPATLRIAYEKRVPFMYNIDLVASFDKSVALKNTGGE